jgi:DNA-binding beta-propeller fold protein YncE
MKTTCALLLICAAFSASAQFTTPLATGVRLDPAGDAIDLGSMPLGMALAPGGGQLAVVLSGWREQGLQIVDLKTRKVTQTITQDAAFFGLAFSPDGAHLYVSGGNDDSIFCYAWKDGAATLERKIVLGKQKEDKTGSRYPAGLAVSKNGRYLYVAENVGDALAVVDLETSDIERLPTDHYPYAVDVAADGNVYVSAWGDDTVSIFHARANGTLFAKSRLRVGLHPSALLTNKSGSRLFVTLAGSDRIAVVDTHTRKIVGMLSDRAPGGPSEGSTPNALAAGVSKLYVAEGDNNAVAVFDIATGKLEGRIPTDWYPTAVLNTGHDLLVLNGKGHGSHANPDGPTPGQGIQRKLGYDLGQLNGTLRITSTASNDASLTEYSRRVAAANNWKEARAPRHYPPFKHVVYIIKENRTYDQVFGDLKEGDGDSSLVFFDKTSTPNHRALALQFGLFDRFFTNAEVSSQGHIWSTAAYVTDYGERTVPSVYSDRRASVDGEELDEPEGGFLWTAAKKAGVSFRDYGEMVAPQGWPKTQADLGSDISPTYPPFNVEIQDQKRADAWIEEHRHFSADGNMPALEVLHLPSDHTAGGNPKYHSPRAYMADNDMALGRIVEALSKSPNWRDTVVFVLEDDSQAGPDHVDSHRGPLLVISAYNRPGTIHRFANTTDVLAAIEDILGLDRLSKFDYFSRSLADVFTKTPNLTPYVALTPEQRLDEMNPEKTAAAKLSEGLDFSAADRVDDARFNELLWLMLKGDQSMPVAQSRASLHLLQISR